MSEPFAPVDLVLLWHHHQPDYRRPRDRRAVLPWARLHASKDYLDMARHLERHPGVRATFNLVPALVDQLEGAAAGDPDELFDLLARPLDSLTPEERVVVAWRCRQFPGRAVETWPAARAARDRAAPRGDSSGGAGAPGGLGDRVLLELEIWFLLAWVDPMFRDEPEAVRALADHPAWSEAHRDDLLVLHARLVAQVIPAYRALAERGQIELSTSPYHHPILPLLVDQASARRAQPTLPLPGERMAVPEDARWHIERALERHRASFGVTPAGMWPSEGSVSPETLGLAARAGLRWLASDEGVLWASLAAAERTPSALYRPWRFASDGGEVTLFFRDRELSDRIGFVYHRWEPHEAASDFVARLRRIGREHGGDSAPVVSVILDGENCWEHYRDDGQLFLTALYDALEGTAEVRTRTPSEVLASGRPAATLARLHSGSWIDADFHIWIGHPEKNRAWELLARTRAALLAAGASAESAPAAWQALYRAEGSDWFWWFGDDHQTTDKAVFDRLFRELLVTAYEEAGLRPAVSLRLPVVRGAANTASLMGPIGFVRPTIDGRRTTFYEWHSAGRLAPGGGGAMHRGEGLARELHYGFDADRFFLRLDFATGDPAGEAVDLLLEIVEPRPRSLRVRGLIAGERVVVWEGGPQSGDPVPGATCHVGPLLELGVPFASLGLLPGDTVVMLVQTWNNGRPLESYPGEEGFTFLVPGPDFEAAMWSA
jgi:alpha-amylase/alpha-mannosidase (GH57 family)